MRLYVRYLSILLRSQMQYKGSFLLTVIGQLLGTGCAFLSIYFLMNRFHQVKDFTLPQVLLCFSVVLMAFSLAECFVRGFDTFPTILSNGEFDRMLVRPRNLMFQVLAAKMELSRIGRFLPSVAMLAYGVTGSGIHWTWDKVGVVVLMIACGALLFSGLFVIYAALSFFTTQGLEFMNIFTDGGREFGQYPLSVYGEGVLKFLTYVVPLALVQYYPLLYLIGEKENPLYGLLPLAALLFLLPCALIWRIGLRHYRSTGS